MKYVDYVLCQKCMSSLYVTFYSLYYTKRVSIPRPQRFSNQSLSEIYGPHLALCPPRCSNYSVGPVHARLPCNVQADWFAKS